MKQVILTGMVLLLAGCGGGDRFRDHATRSGVVRTMPIAFGPISKACMSSDRSSRSRDLCGCIQAAADQTLSGSQQRRAVQFYGNPHMAQEIRQSRRSGDENFWKAYRAYGERAELLCSPAI